MFEGFSREWIDTGEAEIHLIRAGDGPPLLLLHGYPQTHVAWHKVAPALAESFTVVIPDLRGYGDSSGPEPDTGNEAYAKRAMALDMVTIMATLGFERFALAGHDRGGRVAYRLALDHPERVSRLAVLDIIPTLEMAETVDLSLAIGTYHWFFLAQPRPLPERLIAGDPSFYLDFTLDSWAGDPAAIDPEARAQYRRCFEQDSVIATACADYRAGLTTDLAHDRTDLAAGHKIICPLLALWASQSTDGKPINYEGIWRRWAEDVMGAEVPSGHFLMEEAPKETMQFLREFFIVN